MELQVSKPEVLHLVTVAEAANMEAQQDTTQVVAKLFLLPVNIKIMVMHIVLQATHLVHHHKSRPVPTQLMELQLLEHMVVMDHMEEQLAAAMALMEDLQAVAMATAMVIVHQALVKLFGLNLQSLMSMMDINKIKQMGPSGITKKDQKTPYFMRKTSMVRITLKTVTLMMMAVILGLEYVQHLQQSQNLRNQIQLPYLSQRNLLFMIVITMEIVQNLRILVLLLLLSLHLLLHLLKFFLCLIYLNQQKK